MSDSPPKATLTLGTRRSQLARIQTDLVSAALTKLYPSLRITIKASDPLGDRDKVTALYALADGAAAKSVWTGELEEQLERGEVDAIVHSLKDMPTSLPEGMVLSGVLEREDARDVLVVKQSERNANSGSSGNSGEKKRRRAKEILDGLEPGSIVGTSSLRRIAQLRRRWPDLRYETVRGNVATRLKKLDEPESFTDAPQYAVLVLAAAGLIRLDLGERIDAFLATGEENGGVLWAVGQGSIGIEAKATDTVLNDMLAKVNHQKTWLAVSAERALLRKMEGGCSVPIGVQTSWQDGGSRLILDATVVSIDGQSVVETQESTTVENTEQAEALGVAVAQTLLAKGARAILDEIRTEKKVQLQEEAEAVAAAEATAQVLV